MNTGTGPSKYVYNDSSDQQLSQSGITPTNGQVILSPEDRSALKSIQQEAAFKRGYPLGFLLGGATYFGLAKKFPTLNIYARISIIAAAGISGNLIGKISYFPTALKRLETELPHDSQLRQFIEKQRNKNTASPHFHNYNPTMPVQPNASSPPYGDQATDTEHQDVEPMQEAARADSSDIVPKISTYEEMRRKHRESERNFGQNRHPTAPLQTQHGDNYDTPSTDSNTKVRYNKYGDVVLE